MMSELFQVEPSMVFHLCENSGTSKIKCALSFAVESNDMETVKHVLHLSGKLFLDTFAALDDSLDFGRYPNFGPLHRSVISTRMLVSETTQRKATCGLRMGLLTGDVKWLFSTRLSESGNTCQFYGPKCWDTPAIRPRGFAIVRSNA